MVDTKHLELQYVTNDAGERTAVIVPINQFRELIEDIERVLFANAVTNVKVE